MSLKILTLLLILTQAAAQTLMNITIDDKDPMITYQGSGIGSQDSTLAYGGSYTISYEPWTNASFSFNGTAVYFIGLGFVHATSTWIQLDGAIPNLVNLPEANGANTGPARSTILWAANGLRNQMHTLVVTSGPDFDLITDGFIYTTQMEDFSPRPPPTNVIAISVSTSIAFVILVAVVIFIIIIRKRRKDVKTVLSPFESLDTERQSETSLPAFSENFSAASLISRPISAPLVTRRIQQEEDINYVSGETTGTSDSLAQPKARFTGTAVQRGNNERSLGRLQQTPVDYDDQTTSYSYVVPSEPPPSYFPRHSISSSNPFD